MPTHDHDLENLENPEQFDASGFCFAKMKLQKDVKKFDMVAASPKFFCSDPYWAPCDLEIMVAHIILNYDVRLEN